MTTKDVTIKGGDELDIPRNPVAILEGATAAAKALKDVVSRKEKPVIMNGEQYLEYEDWQTVGQFYHYTAKTHDAVPVEINGVPGFKAYADLVDFRTGLIVGGAEAYCMRDESKWNTRTVYEWQGEGKDRHRVAVGEEAVPWYQLASMAQTRAGAKALRNRLAWVVVLAGYKPTPAEEVTGDDERKRDQPRTHFCTLHHCSFFKRGKMTSYAHPIKDAQGKDTGQWCYEPAEKPATTTEAPPTTPEKSTPEGSQGQGEADQAPPAEAKAETAIEGVDLPIVKESLRKIGWDKGKTPPWRSWLKSKANYTGLNLEGTLEEVLTRMDKAQKEFFVGEIQTRAEMS